MKYKLTNWILNGKKVTLFYYQKVTSTQDIAKSFIIPKIQVPNSTVIVAGQQSQGRGRFDRYWHSSSGGLWCTLILTSEVSFKTIPMISVITGLAVVNAIEELTGIKVLIKWPNDVMVDENSVKIIPTFSSSGRRPLKVAYSNRWKKLGGILIETLQVPDLVALIGIGINVNNIIPSGLRNIAISLKEIGIKVSWEKLLKKIIIHLFQYYKLVSQHKKVLLAMYERKSMLLGKLISIKSAGKIYQGTAISFTNGGGLVLQISKQQYKTFISGEVTFIRQVD